MGHCSFPLQDKWSNELQNDWAAGYLISCEENQAVTVCSFEPDIPVNYEPNYEATIPCLFASFLENKFQVSRIVTTVFVNSMTS